MKRIFLKRKDSKPPSRSSPTTASFLDATTHNNTPHFPAKFAASAIPHPLPYERILVYAALDGLLLRPDVLKAETVIKIGWGKGAGVEEVDAGRYDDLVGWTEAAVVYGVLGMVRLFTDAYILLITDRTNLGSFLDPSQIVYGVKSVAYIALDRDQAIKDIQKITKRHKRRPQGFERTISVLETPTTNEKTRGHVTFSPSTDEREGAKIPPSTSLQSQEQEQEHGLSDDSAPSTPALGTTPLRTTIGPPNPAQLAKAIATKLSFWNPNPNPQGTATLKTSLSDPAISPETIRSLIIPAPSLLAHQHSELDIKIARELVKQYTKSGMYFSYSFNLSSTIKEKVNLQEKTQKKKNMFKDLQRRSPDADREAKFSFENDLEAPQAAAPLWKRMESRFWWNEYLMNDFIEAGLHSYIIPVLQGHWQTVQFSTPLPPSPSNDDELPPDVSLGETLAQVDYTLISRRSRERAGLRFQRRGADDAGDVANFVETEAVMCLNRDKRRNVFSFVQIRGSIPLYWSQPGVNLKPAPQLSSDRTKEQNNEVMKRHLEKTLKRYGPHTLVNLAECHGKEGPLTDAYKQSVMDWGTPDVRYCGYDFHAETKGMKYENISKLIDNLDKEFDAQGYTWISDSSVLSRQKGVFRVNCIDCLDRTNVVQSAIARHVLQHQLNATALPTSGSTLPPEINVAFNDVWANNGDAISRAYAGTSALKGDFTRTGKRDLGGMLNDGVNSLARMYTSTFSDWFSQAVIDFMLGYRSVSVFSEFLHKLSTSEPAEMIRVSKIRTAAIETSASFVLTEEEHLQYGWTLLSPADVNVRISDAFEEKVLLLSSKALYIVSFDYHLEKVQMFTRVPIDDIRSLQQGAYILSSLEEGSRDPRQNFGFVITFSSHRQTTRVSSYSIRNSVDVLARSVPSSPTFREDTPLERQDSNILSDILSRAAASADSGENFAAFKALPIDGSTSYVHLGVDANESSKLEMKNCRETVDFITHAIMQACHDFDGHTKPLLEHRDIVSLAEAQRTESLLSKVEYGVKRLLWLGA